MESPYSKELNRLTKHLKRTKDALPFAVISAACGTLSFLFSRGTYPILVFILPLVVLLFLWGQLNRLSGKFKEVTTLNNDWLQEYHWNALLRLTQKYLDVLETDTKESFHPASPSETDSETNLE